MNLNTELCFAMGDSGDKAIDPNTFKIIDGKLYLFYNAF
jgi:hypothetical protein